ncbi:amino acid adenylation domain protein [Sporosarcina newyorkensis 2681]|uniref:Amino acid adenylation domain protein n=1 Tax=Sporosarcina newyorkensis 2681 TaxID=1027292 RepID=F9DMM8_9BACL|nr:amino acid adenylation domain protein [Sporosarcina newyorkensis 2681]
MLAWQEGFSMEISLVRHGKSKHADNNNMACNEFKIILPTIAFLK